MSTAVDVEAWVTTADQSRLLARESGLSFAKRETLANRIDVDAKHRYQSIVGFGAAVTDASAWLIQTRLNEAQRAALLKELFGRDGGLGLSFTRISIGASDFSRSHYSLDDTPDGKPDPDLTHFSIEPNRAELLPVLRAAGDQSRSSHRCLALESAWLDEDLGSQVHGDCLPKLNLRSRPTRSLQRRLRSGRRAVVCPHAAE